MGKTEALFRKKSSSRPIIYNIHNHYYKKSQVADQYKNMDRYSLINIFYRCFDISCRYKNGCLDIPNIYIYVVIDDQLINDENINY